MIIMRSFGQAALALVILLVVWAALLGAAPPAKTIPDKDAKEIRDHQVYILRAERQQRLNLEAVQKANDELAKQILERAERLKAAVAAVETKHCGLGFRLSEDLTCEPAPAPVGEKAK